MQHLIEIITVFLLAIVGFVGRRVFISLDKLTEKHHALDKENTKQHGDLLNVITKIGNNVK